MSTLEVKVWYEEDEEFDRRGSFGSQVKLLPSLTVDRPDLLRRNFRILLRGGEDVFVTYSDRPEVWNADGKDYVRVTDLLLTYKNRIDGLVPA